MFEKLIENLLQQVLGEYIEGLDQQSLKVGIWSGEAKIENLRLKPDAFIKLDLPFIVNYSKLGTLNLSIPWKNLASAPIKANLDTLYLILTPQEARDWKFGCVTGADKFIEVDSFKQKLLERISNKEQQDGMMQRIIIRVIENLQITIQNIHIRVEDAQISYGFVLQNFTLLTINEQGVEQFIDRTSNKNQQLIKSLQISNIGLYWKSQGGIQFSESLFEKEIPKHDYLFRISLQSKVVQPPKQSENLPDFKFDLDLQSFDIQLSKPQLQQIINLAHYLNSYNRAKIKFQKQQLMIQPLDQKDQRRIKQLLQSVQLDKKYKDGLNKDQKQELCAILEKTQIEEVKPIVLEVIKEQQFEDMKQKALKKKQPQGFLQNWFGKGKQQQQNETPTLLEEESEEIQKFLQQNFSQDDSLQLNQGKATQIVVNGKMRQGTIILSNPRQQKVDQIKIIFQDLNCNLKSDRNLKVDLSLIDIIVLFNDQQFLTNTSNDNSKPIFLLNYNLIESTTTQTQLETRSSKLRFHPDLITVLNDFRNVDLKSNQIKNMATDRIQEMKQNAQAALANQVIVEKNRWVNITMDQFYFEIPINNSQESWLFCPGLVSINSSIVNGQELFKVQISNIGLKYLSQTQYSVIDNFAILLDLQLPNQKNQNIIVNAKIQDIITNLNPQIYQKLIKIEDCLTPSISAQEYKKQNKSENIENKMLIENVIDMGPLYIKEGPLNQWIKYTCVMDGSNLYFYTNPKSQQPIYIKYVKNSSIVEKGIDEFKMNILIIANENNSFEIGIQNQNQIQDLIQKISSCNDLEKQLLKQLENEQDKQQLELIEFKKFINFTISVVQINLQDSNSKQFLVLKTNDLSLRMKVHSEFLQVQISLSGLQLQDNLRSYCKQELSNLIISEKENGELIEILFHQTKRISKNYKDVDKQIELKFGKLHVNFKSETIAYLQQFIGYKKKDNQKDQSFDKIEQEFLEAEKRFLLLKMNVQINQISLTIIHEITKLPFLDIQFQDSAIEILKYQDELQMQVNLGNLQINDLTNNPYTLTKEEDYHLIKPNQILGIKQKGQSLLFVKIILIEPLSKKAQLNRDIISIDAKISQIVTDYQQQPILRIIDYIQNLKEPFINPYSFQVQGYHIENILKQFVQPSIIIVEPSKDEAIKITNNPPRLKLKVEIDNPQIIIRNKFSNEFMILNLGIISVSNIKQQINSFYKDIYTIQITQLNITGECDSEKSIIASDFNLSLTVTVPDLVKYYKQISNHVDEAFYVNCELSQFILNVDRNTVKLINRLIIYNFTLNDSFNQYVLLNTEKSNQINQEQSKIILKQDVQKRVRNQDYFMKLKLKIINISIFLCLHRPLIRLSIVDSNIEFNMKKDDKKEIVIDISSFNSCVYEQVDAYYVSKPLIGIQVEKKYDDLHNLRQLIENASNSNKESGKIEIYINPTQNQTHNKLYLKFESFLLTIQTKIILQTLTIFEGEELTRFVNTQLQEHQLKYDEYLRSQQKEEEVQPTDSQILITLGDVIIGVPSNEDSILTFTGKFNIILNTQDTVSSDELLCLIKEKGLSYNDQNEMNYKIKSSVSVEQVQAYVASKQQLYSQQFNQIENKRQIIWPFTMLLNQSQQLVLSEDQDTLVEKQTIRLSLSPFEFRIAFTDVLFIQNQINNQLQIINELTNNDIRQQQKEMSNQQKQNKLQNIDLVIDGFEVMILNDIENHYQYIMKFTLFQTETKLEKTSRNFKFIINLPIQLLYYNQNIGIWEPIIETCDISIIYIKDLAGFDLVSENQLDVLIKDGVNINISTQMISTVYPAWTILTQRLQAKNKNQIRFQHNSYAKYAIYNQLGSEVLCETQDNKMIIVQQNEYKDFDINNSNTNHSVNLQIQGDKMPFEITNWNINKLQQKIKKIVDNSPVLIKNFVDQLKNQRVIYLSSEYIFENNTQTHLELIFKDAKGNLHISNLQPFMQNPNAQQITNQPNQYVLPQYLLQSEFYIRRALKNQEKSQSYNIKYLNKCYESKEALKLQLNENFFINLNVRKDPEFYGRYIIYIQPNFRLQNLLPFPVTISRLSEYKQIEVAKVQPLQYLDEHQIKSIKESHSILIDIDSYKQSQPIQLLNSRNFKLQQIVISLVGEEGLMTKGGKSDLILEYNYALFNQSGLCSAVLFAQEYVKNETQYDFFVCQGKNEQYSFIGGQKQGSLIRPLILNNSNKYNDLVFSDRSTPHLYSRTPAQINSIGTTTSDIIFNRKEVFYIAPLSVTSEIKLIQNTCQKVVSIKNRIILVNNSDHSICIKQFKVFGIGPHQRMPLEICFADKIPPSSEGIYQFQFTFMEELNWNWSGQIECNQIGVFYVQLRSNIYPEIRKFAQIDINETNGVLFVVISETKHDQTPYRITNQSNMITVTVLSLPAELDCNQDCYFAWDEPTRQNNVPLIIYPKINQYEVVEYQFRIDKITDPIFFALRSLIPNDNDKIIIKLITEMNGFTRHAQFIDSSEEEMQKYKKNQGKEIQGPQQLKFDIVISQVNLSLIDNHLSYPQEIINIVLYQSEAILLINKQSKAIFQCKLSALQIDNTSQLHPLFPVLLTLLPTGKVKQQFPILNVLIQMNLQAKKLQLIEKFSLETNRLAIKINDAILKTILKTINKMILIKDNQQQKLQQKFDWKLCPLPDKLIPTYFGSITIYPIIIQVTVQWSNKNKDQDANNSMFTSLLSGVGFQLASVDEAEIALKGIRMDDVFDSIHGLCIKLTQRYLSNIQYQLPAILGSLAVIGNPTKLLKNFVSGMQDLIERPIEGFTKGPLEGGMGVLKGATSLVSHTVSGVFNSVKNVVGTISSGLSKVTMDESYQKQRQIQNQQQARNVGSGIQEGSVSLAKGVAGGITGFFSKPIQGAQQHGASGLLKGLWQGTSGLIIKPVTGVLDVISKTSEGVKNQLSSDEQPNNNRIRYMRPFYESDGYYKEYNWIEAECYEVVKGIKNGKYENHRFLKVVAIERDNKTYGLIQTDLSLILFDLDQHQKLWSILYKDVQNIDCRENVIQLKNKKSKRAFQGKSVIQLPMSSTYQSQQITEEIKFMKQQL